jgi:hypothetical protein
MQIKWASAKVTSHRSPHFKCTVLQFRNITLLMQHSMRDSIALRPVLDCKSNCKACRISSLLNFMQKSSQVCKWAENEFDEFRLYKNLSLNFRLQSNYELSGVMYVAHLVLP